MRTLLAGVLLLLGVTAAAQEGFPLDGTWRGTVAGPGGTQRTIVLVMMWDGKSVTGTYQSRTIDFCASGDPICENGGGDVGAHLGYTANADAAATFAATKL